MEEQNQNIQPVQQNNGMNKLVLPTVIMALIVLGAIGFYLYNSGKKTEDMVTKAPVGEVIESQTPAASSMEQTTGVYKDGTYSVAGNYVSPGGPRTLNVKITLANGVISAAEVKATATDATSKRFQGEFVDNFKPMVIGKNIDEVTLTKVAGSSLSPKGFNDALSKVKTKAAS